MTHSRHVGEIPTRPDLAVVIPSWNERENLELLLPALKEVIASLGLTAEIVVADGGARDGTPRVAHVPSRRADGTHACGARLRCVGGDPDPGACGRMAHPRDSVPVHVSWLRPFPRAVLPVRVGLRENPRANVEAAQLRRCGRL